MSKQTNRPAGYLIMYGLAEDSRPRAARFQASERAAVERAASQLRYQLIETNTEALLKLAKQLPGGKIFATGRSLVPYVRQPLYERLVSAATPDTRVAKPARNGKADTPKQGNSACKDTPVATVALKTTVLIGLSPPERRKLLSAWPSKNRNIPDFCERLVVVWEAVWLSEISAQFAGRARVFNYADFERCDLLQFAPTLSRCWQQRTVWAVHLIDNQWHLWTAIASAKDFQSVTLMFDVTDADDARHPALTDAKLDSNVWRSVSNRHYQGFVTGQLPIVAKSINSSAEIAKLSEIAKNAIAVAQTLVSATAPAPVDTGD